LRARGISNRRIYFVHALREVMIPLVNYLAPALSGVLIGTVVVEQVFNIPGLGRYLVSAASNRDYTLVLGIVWLSSLLIIGFNLVADLAVGVLDPRIRYQ
jgi:oligopeptide transport system permease protein